MAGPDVDAVRFYLQAHPELAERVRFDPLRVRGRRGWRSVRSVRVRARGIELHFRRGSSVRLYPFDARQASRLEQIELLADLVKVLLGGGRFRTLLTETDRNVHQSGAFLRGIVETAGHRDAVIAVFEGESYELSTRLVSAIVLWWSQSASNQCRRLIVLIPQSWGTRIVSYFPVLEIPLECFQYAYSGPSLRRIYPGQPRSTEVASPYVFHPLVEEVPAPLRRAKSSYPALDLLFRQDRWELSYLGLPVLWTIPSGRLYFDFRAPRKLSEEGDLKRHLEKVFAIRRFPPPAPESYYYRFGRERWLESLLLKQLRHVNADFGGPVYCQVPTWLEGERRVLDLLTVTRDTRLAILELKLEKDLNLIFQGFDYWDRVRHHLERGDFHRAGYFRQVELRREAPLLYLVSPLFEFHRVLPLFRKYLRPDIRFECLGINHDWKKGLKILRRFAF